ncbi:MAG: tRNA pseudouridine(38-40) synthase TruA [Tepidisphaerales bacterium]
MPTVRYKLVLAYRGTHYHGWQKQGAYANYKGPKPKPGHGIPTIQEIVARALGEVLGHPVKLVGSSRTDTGVHAKGQLAHLDTDQVQIPPAGLRRATNCQLPDDILIRSIEPADPQWDAIGSTLSKRYQYAIWNDEDRLPLFCDLVWHRRLPLDFEAMRTAARHFLGTHNFASFAKPGHHRGSTVRTVLSCDLSRRGPLIVFGIEGKGFLWNMVRIMVGTLSQVGLGLFKPDDIRDMLAAHDRRKGGSTAPPHGLYLQWIKTARRGDRRKGEELEQ